MHFSYRGVEAKLSSELVADAQEYTGILIPTLLRTSINRMLGVSGKESGDFNAVVKIVNSQCDADECVFELRVKAIARAENP